MTTINLSFDPASRRELSHTIENLINMLDDLSPDCDLEDGADLEPSLGWAGHSLPTVSFLQDGRGSMHDDRELDDSDHESNGDEMDASATSSWAKGGHWCEDVGEENEHGADVLDERHDGESDSEPWLGWANAGAQDCIGTESIEGLQDSPDFGGLGNFTGQGIDEARDMLRGRGRNECSLTIVGPVIAPANWHGIPPTEPDAMDAKAHYWAAKGF